jgi:hypothetical protein
MNLAHLHLIMNHAPVLGAVFALGLFIFAQWVRSEDFKRAALGVLVINALLALPAYFTGEPAEGMIKSVPGVMESLIEPHEDAAGVALTGVLLLGAGALAGLIFFRKGKIMPAWFSAVILAAALIVSALMAWTANLGGKIHHPEIRNQANFTASLNSRASGE